jgi:hypothetical protein
MQAISLGRLVLWVRHEYGRLRLPRKEVVDPRVGGRPQCLVIGRSLARKKTEHKTAVSRVLFAECRE